MSLSGLSQINCELSSRCDKEPLCAMCGHQSSKVNVGLRYGDMDFHLLRVIAAQIPHGTIVQFHRDGDPLVYPALAEALDLFSHCIRSIVTHGGRLGDRAHDILGRCERVTVSVFEGDPAGPVQLEQVSQFLECRAASILPALNIKIVGEMTAEGIQSWQRLGVPIIRRQLHHPAGDWRYRGSGPPIPEAMICMDLLTHPSIDWEGNLYLCNRLQPKGEGKLGNLYASSLEELWNGEARAAIIRQHVLMQREQVPACRGCEFWGLPAG